MKTAWISPRRFFVPPHPIFIIVEIMSKRNMGVCYLGHPHKHLPWKYFGHRFCYNSA